MNIIRNNSNFNELDKVDEKIINLLQKNARLSNKEIALEVGIAESTCSERMRKLNQKKIFLGFHSFVNSSYLGVNIQAIIAVKLKRHSKEVVENFKLALKDNKEIVNTYHMASNSDFLLHVAVTDKDHLRNFVMDKLTALKSVKKVETSLIYDFVHNPLFPIYH